MYFHLTVEHTQTEQVRIITLDAVDIEDAHEQMGYLRTPFWQAVSLDEVTAEQVAAEEAAENAAYAAAGYRVF